MKPGSFGLLLALLLWAPPHFAQTDDPSVVFRRANENAARSRWDDASADYGRLLNDGVRAPSVYWNWAQAASAFSSVRAVPTVWKLIRSER